MSFFPAPRHPGFTPRRCCPYGVSGSYAGAYVAWSTVAHALAALALLVLAVRWRAGGGGGAQDGDAEAGRAPAYAALDR